MKYAQIVNALAVLCLLSPDTKAGMNIVALIPAHGQFLVALEGIQSQVGAKYTLRTINMTSVPKVEEVAAECKSMNPDGLILMDSKAIKITCELQKYDSVFTSLPKFVLMTLMAESMTKGLSNVAGVKFEVPLYTLVTDFRIISQKEFSTVGIFYRSPFGPIIEESRKLLEKEGITVKAYCIGCDQKGNPSPEEALAIMKKTLDGIVKKEKVDVFIIPADNFIFNTTSMEEFWIGKVKKMKIPGIASIDMLASDKYAVAVFTADPDISQLGAQVANQIIAYFEDKTPLSKIGFEPTISIKSTVNVKVANEIGWKIKNEKLGRITTIINN
jgi:ABC-type uncharacterized transport system substrate-binding protein